MTSHTKNILIQIININKNIIIHHLYMDNNINKNDTSDNTFNDSYNTVKNLYKNIGFIDQYGGDVFLCFIYFMIPIFIFFYFKTIKDIQPIKDDWANQRCKPTVIPFA